MINQNIIRCTREFVQVSCGHFEDEEFFEKSSKRMKTSECITKTVEIFFFRIKGKIISKMYRTYHPTIPFEIFWHGKPHKKPYKFDDLSKRVYTIGQAKKWIRKQLLRTK